MLVFVLPLKLSNELVTLEFIRVKGQGNCMWPEGAPFPAGTYSGSLGVAKPALGVGKFSDTVWTEDVEPRDDERVQVRVPPVNGKE